MASSQVLLHVFCFQLAVAMGPLLLHKTLCYLLVVGGVVSVQAAGVCPPTLAVAAAGRSVVAIRGQGADLVPATATHT